ncbi:MAG: hypothetical protein M3Q48_12010 [Actinomycetota bacterium]|nr:hypothetical protein [Actinomycetota bacterium]
MDGGWTLVAIPGTTMLLVAVLYLSAVAEQRFLSPRSLILGVVRARRNTPEFAEAFVARQFERILREEQNGWRSPPAAAGATSGTTRRAASSLPRPPGRSRRSA